MALFFNNFNQSPNFMQNNPNVRNNNINNNSLFSRLFLNRQNQMFNNNLANRGFGQMPQQMPQPINNGFNQQMPQQIQPQIQNSEITLKPLTEEEFSKINEEIQENIEKNRQQIFPVNQPKEKDKILLYLQQFIQDEKNANIFYTSLANNCNNNYYKNKLQEIGKECDTETNSLKKYYKSLENEDFEPEDLQINTNIPLKQGLLLAIEEEIASYNKICNILDEQPFEDTREFYKMALKKLSRINSIQYMAMDKNI